MRWFLTVLVLTAAACRGAERAAQADLAAERPNAQLLETFVGEGDFDHAYVHLCFRPAPDSQARAEVWLYQRRDGGWHAITAPGARVLDHEDQWCNEA